MGYRSIRVHRLYKNSIGELLRMDTVLVRGYVARDKAWVLGERALKRSPITGGWVHDFGTFKFNSTGRRVVTTTYNVTANRTITEVEMVGNWLSIQPAPNYNGITWEYGEIDLSDLPQVGDIV
jgi:hypothetical protein